MKEWVCREISTTTRDAENGILTMETELIRCKDCKWYDMTDSSGTVEPIGYRCKKVNRLWREPDDFCKGAERKEE